jgi:hypothetical protein
MKYLATTVLAGILSGCTDAQPPTLPPSWVTIDARQFTFSAPPDLRAVPVRGIDSYVGRYTNQTVVLSFDYGWYSDPLTDNYKQRANYKKEHTKVDGRKAVIVTFSRPSEQHAFDHCIGIHFPDLGDGRTKLTIFARCATTNLWTVLRDSFRSIHFTRKDAEQRRP